MNTREAVTRLAKVGMIIDEVTNVSFQMLIREHADIGSFVRLDSIRKIYMEKYALEIKKGKLQPIEHATEEIKRHYWDWAGQYTSDRQTRTEGAKVIYLIEWLCAQAIDSGGADGIGAEDPTPAQLYGMATKQPARSRP
jgi:hypothetical protein